MVRVVAAAGARREARALTDIGVGASIFDQYESAGGGLWTQRPPQPRPLSNGSPLADFFATHLIFVAVGYDSLDQVWASRGVLF